MLTPATWYSAGQTLWAGFGILATLWYAQSLSARRGHAGSGAGDDLRHGGRLVLDGRPPRGPRGGGLSLGGRPPPMSDRGGRPAGGVGRSRWRSAWPSPSSRIDSQDQLPWADGPRSGPTGPRAAPHRAGHSRKPGVRQPRPGRPDHAGPRGAPDPGTGRALAEQAVAPRSRARARTHDQTRTVRRRVAQTMGHQSARMRRRRPGRRQLPDRMVLPRVHGISISCARSTCVLLFPGTT